MVIYFSGFIVLVITLLALDLGVFHRKDEVMSAKSALGWTAIWIAISLVFNALVYVFYEHHWLGIGSTVGLPTDGKTAAIAFFTAYIVEKSLSIDNIFVIAMVFSYFKVPAIFQHRVLFWGILGALLMRGLMIAAGIVALSQFSWLTYVLGGLLIITAIRMMTVQHDSLEPEKNILMRLVEKWLPLTKQFHGHHFFVRLNHKWTATPLFLALVLIESTDLLFAVDSIPAVLAITLDPFIVFTSNVFAILGMRSLYFALASMMDRFRYLKHSLIFILAFVGVKMILAHHIAIDPLASLAVIVTILSIGVGASLLISAEQLVNPPNIKGEIKRISRVTVKTVRRVFFLVAGVTVLLIGAVMIFLPGPGVLVMFLGLALLAVEFVWARAWMKKAQTGMHDLQEGAKDLLKRRKK
jgi:tellurite resistance protein TerC